LEIPNKTGHPEYNSTTTFADVNPYGTAAFYTLGCKLNFSETSTIVRSFEDAGFATVSFDERADYYVINTCSVTDHADKKCRNIVRRAKALNPEAKVIVIGCYAQLKPQEIIDIPGVNLVLGANEKFNVLAYLSKHSTVEKQLINSKIKEVHDFHPAYSQGDRTRSFVKVQDGCDYFCAFCTIPLARGRSRSADIAQSIEIAEKAVEAGAKELVLTGVNIGDFGVGSGESFLDLVKSLDTISGVQRIRISSIEPNLLSDTLIEFCAHSRLFAPHFHIPLQSGSDTILSAMRRRYDTTLYRRRIEKIRSVMSDACIGVDVLVGFPGETDALFEETFEFLHAIDVNYFHVFTYSERPNTTAVRMADVVPKHEREMRNKRLRILSEKKKRAFYIQQTGKNAKVLWEAEQQEDGLMLGYTENYIRCTAPYDATKINLLENIILAGTDENGFMRVLPSLVNA
jgi:threonylcarbamoyladenosine tRNA methylthiotransferase MtaB